MKRSPRTIFDDRGHKWFQSPIFKEVRIDGGGDDRQIQTIRDSYSDPFQIARDKFYDFYTRATKIGISPLRFEDVIRNMTITIDDIPSNEAVQDIFERLNSRITMNSKGKKIWTDEETSFLVWVTISYCDLNKIDYHVLSDNDWEYIASIIPGKNSELCKQRWQGLVKLNLSRIPWSQEEDDILVHIIEEKGAKKWKEIAIELNEKMNNTQAPRQGKQCRERWINHLDPSINRGVWTAEEDILLIELEQELGKRWAEISKKMKTRTENAVKNRWNSLMKKYKSEVNFDDSTSQVSGVSNNTMDDLEKKITNMILEDKKKERSRMTTPHSQGLEVIEEYSPDNDSDIKSEYYRNDLDQDSTSMGSQRRQSNAKQKDVSKRMNTLKKFVTQELDNKQKTPDHPSPNDGGNSSNPLFPQGISQIQGMNNTQMGGGSNATYYGSTGGGFHMESPGLFKQQNQLNQEPPSNLFNEMSSFNLFQSSPNPNKFSQRPNNASNVQTMNAYPVDSSQQQVGNNNAQQINEQQQESNERMFKLHQKPLDQLPIQQGENNYDGYSYAIIDMNNNAFYVLQNLSKDNFPPNLGQNTSQQNQSSNSMNNFNFSLTSVNEKPNNNNFNDRGLSKKVSLEFASPALGNVNFSPNLFNNNLVSMMKNSPAMGIWNESPQVRSMFNNNLSSMYSSNNSNQPNNNSGNTAQNANTGNQGQEGNYSGGWNNNNNEWATPETNFRSQNLQDSGRIRPVNMMWGGENYKGPNSPDNRFSANNSAFLRKQMEKKGTNNPLLIGNK